MKDYSKVDKSIVLRYLQTYLIPFVDCIIELNEKAVKLCKFIDNEKYRDVRMCRNGDFSICELVPLIESIIEKHPKVNLNK